MNPDDLDPATKARIEAEEKYRAQVRAKVAPAAPQKPPPPVEEKGGIGCGTWILIFTVLIVFIGMAQQCSGSSSPSSSTVRSGPSDNERLGSFGYTCEKIVKDNIKAPSTAEFTNYYSDQQAGALTGTFASGYTWRTYVDAENSFGAKIRTRFTCTTAPGSETVRVSFDP